MRSTEAVSEARRQMEICNACRYCESFCAVFPALERRRSFADSDVSFLANLCHGCKGCFYACQYAPPHPFAVNLPKTLATVRAESYADYAWPRPLARLFQRNGMMVSLVVALVCIAVVSAIGGFVSTDRLFGVQTGAGAFYRIVPKGAMTLIAEASFLYALLALAMGARNFWRDAGSAGKAPRPAKAAANAAGDVLTLRNLSGGGHGCNDRDESFSSTRRWLHHAMFYGFLLCFASTTSGWVFDRFLGVAAPYPLLSTTVLLGTVGGVLLFVGTAGLLIAKATTDQTPVDRRLLGADAALLVLLATVALTGLLLLAFRATSGMGMLLAVHLGLVLSLFLVLPYSKFVHGVYRSAALLRDRLERGGAPIGGGADHRTS